MFEFTPWHASFTDFFIKLRHNTAIGKQLLFANNRNRVRRVVLCLSQDGACTDSFENFRENSLKGDLSNDITLNPPFFSLVNTFKLIIITSSYPYFKDLLHRYLISILDNNNKLPSDNYKFIVIVFTYVID